MLNKLGYIDMHCDTLLHAVAGDKKDVFSMEACEVDAARLYEAEAMAQCFAVFFPPTINDDIKFFKQAKKILTHTLDNYSDKIAYAGNIADLERNIEAGKVSAFLTVEDGRAVDGSIENLEWFYNQGVRMISLTWNHENCFGYPNSRDSEVMQKGLTAFGKEAIEVMNDLGIVVDVSHLSDGGFMDVARISKVPFVASHSNARAVTNHQRNLTDDMIRILADKGGVTGLNFAADFVESAEHTHHSSIERICVHAKHLLNVGGEDVIAIGTDFDGTNDKLEIDNPTKMYLLFEGLKKKGFTQSQIDKVAYRNIKRVFADTMK